MIGKRDARLKQNREKGEIANKEKEKKDGPDIVREMYGPSVKPHLRGVDTNSDLRSAPR